MRTKSLYIFFLAAIVLACCQKNEINPDWAVSDGIVKYTPSISGNGVMTKAQSSSAETFDTALISEDGTMSIPMTVTSSEGIGMGEATSGRIVTKGELINEFGPGPQPFDTDETFVVKAWDASTSGNIIPGTAAGEYQTVTYSSSSSKWGTSKDYSWQDGETKTFYAYSNLPSSGASISNTTAASQTLTYTVPSTASAQTDILMGFYSGDGKTGSPATMTGTASILFSHPLTAVQFKLGTIDGITSFVVNSISIEGVYSSGTAVMTPATAAEADPKDRFTWTPSGSNTVSQNISTQPTSTNPKIGEAFLLIPQSFNSESTAKIVINCTIDGKTADLYHILTSGNWKAGYTNTYTLGYGSGTDPILTVDGEVYTDYQAVGTKSYSVTSNAPWKLQYTNDDGATWNDAVANTLINDWIKFDIVSGDGSDAVQTVNATVIDASEPSLISTDHSEILQSATPKGTAGAPYDLSMHTIYGESRAAGKPVTANSYVINSPGWYAFPLVYGNAIDYTKNAADGVNTEAYQPTPYPSDEYTAPLDLGRLPIFKSATGDITSPYITGAASAYPLWEDLPGYAILSNNSTDCKVISSDEASTMGLALGGRCGYVIFHVNNENLDQGNAVIAVKDSEGTILWSWHIWVTDDDLTCINVNNGKEGKYNFNKGVMPVNLGWVDFGSSKNVYEGRTLQIRFVQQDGGSIINEVPKTATREEYLISGGVSGQCPFYQWGRKDPFIRLNGLDNGDEMTSDSYSGSFIDTSKKSSDPGIDLSFSIRNPNYFVVSEGNNDNWYGYDTYYNLWDAKTNKEYNNVISVCLAPYKSVYDPCPPGFQVPQEYAFDGFSKEDKKIYDIDGTRVLGFDFSTHGTGKSTILFPMTGTRSASTGLGSIKQTIYPFSHIVSNYSFIVHGFLYVDLGSGSFILYTNYGNSQNIGGAIRPVEE